MSFCKCDSLKDHATDIFQNIIISLEAYVHSLFVSPQLMGGGPGIAIPSQTPALISGLPIGAGVSPQPGFSIRGVWLPLVITFPAGQTKST